MATKDGGTVVPGFESNVVDTTGAGDAFLGGFLFKISRSEKNLKELTLEELEDFTRFANAVASICVQGYGAIASMPTIENVNEIM